MLGQVADHLWFQQTGYHQIVIIFFFALPVGSFSFSFLMFFRHQLRNQLLLTVLQNAAALFIIICAQAGSLLAKLIGGDQPPSCVVLFWLPSSLWSWRAHLSRTQHALMKFMAAMAASEDVNSFHHYSKAIVSQYTARNGIILFYYGYGNYPVESPTNCTGAYYGPSHSPTAVISSYITVESAG